MNKQKLTRYQKLAYIWDDYFIQALRTQFGESYNNQNQRYRPELWNEHTARVARGFRLACRLWHKEMSKTWSSTKVLKRERLEESDIKPRKQKDLRIRRLRL